MLARLEENCVDVPRSNTGKTPEAVTPLRVQVPELEDEYDGILSTLPLPPLV